MRKSCDDVTESLHEMLAEYNSKRKSKVFYYSEEEVKDLCKHANEANLPSHTFEIWWNNVKKK